MTVKRFKTGFCLLLAALIVAAGLPQSIISSAASTDGTVIFSADPSKLGTVGTDATSAGLTDASWNEEEIKVGKDGETDTFVWEHTFSEDTGVKFRKAAFKTGYSSENIPWIADSTVLQALKGYITLSFKARITGEDLPASGYDTTFWVLPIDKSMNRSANWGSIIRTETVGKNDGWKTLSVTPTDALAPFGSGDFFVQFSLKADNLTKAVKWEIADIKLTVNSSYKDEINSKLSAAGSSWTYDKIVEAYEDRDIEPVPSKMHVIWDADPDKYDMAAGGNATATFSNNNISKAEVTKGYGDRSSYFTTSIDFTGQNSSGASDYAVVDGYNYTEYTYGWTQLPQIMNVIVKYAYSAADFRVSGENLPTASNIYFSLAGKHSTQVGKIAILSSSVSGDGDWQSIEYTKLPTLTEQPNNGWYYSQWRYNLYAPRADSKFNDVVKIDVRGFRLALDERDRLAINAELKNIADTVTDEQMNYFTKGETVGTDAKGNPDYFELLIRHDAVSSWGEKAENEHKVILAGNTTEGDCEMSIETTRFVSGDTVTLNVSTEAGYEVSSISVIDAEGDPVQVETTHKNSTYTFVMPDSDVTVTAVTEKIPKRDFTWLAYVNAGAQSSYKQPTTMGGSNSVKKTVVGDTDTSAFEFEILTNSGKILIYTNPNVNIALADYLDKAEVIVNAKFITSSDNKTVNIGTNGGTAEYSATVDSDWTEIRFPLSDIYSGSLDLTFSLENLSAGDKLYIGNIYILNDSFGYTEAEMYDKIFDMSGYEKQKTNTLIGKVADPEGSVTPWNVTREDKTEEQKDVINWDIAWYAPFQNMSPYIVSPVAEDAGDNYNLVFFQAEDFKEPLSKYVDTGYAEFFINASVDGTTVPFMVYEKGVSGNNEAVFTVRYSKAKAREDGYMCVRIPLTFFADNGFSLSGKLWVSIKGNQIIEDYFYMSSWRFYDRYADVPEPEPIAEEEPLNERDIPIDLDTSILNGKLDKENLILYVPKGTYIWELLAAIKLDTEESNIDFFSSPEFIDDENVLLTEDMDMLIYRRGFFVTQFKIRFIKTEIPASSQEPTPTPTQKPGVDAPVQNDTPAESDPGTASQPEENSNLTAIIIAVSAAAVLVICGIVLFILLRRRRRALKEKTAD